jgi:uncharacterized protein YbjT (DUF2867 family)
LPMYTIVGATGFIGRDVAQKLLAAGEKVRVVGRSGERLAPLVEKGAEPFIVDSLLDQNAMIKAFSGAKAAYTMAPPISIEVSYGKVGDVMAQAASKNGVSHIVNLSAIGAHLHDRGGHCMDYYDLEGAFGKIKGLNVLHLRPTFFMTSFFAWIDPIKSTGKVGGLLLGDIGVPRIASRDIAAVAAEALMRLNFSGTMTRELLGQRDISMNEAAQIIGKAIGKDTLRYVELSLQESIDMQVARGRSAASAEKMNEEYAGWNNGTVRSAEERSAANTTPTSFETFVAEEFVPRFTAN